MFSLLAVMRRYSGLFFIILLVLGLCSCATPYREATSGKGFSDSQLSADEFEVSFRGNGQTELERATEFVLLRSAQVTLKNGFSHFAVMDSINTSSAKRYTVRQKFYRPASPETGFPVPTPNGTTLGNPGYLVEVEEPRIYYQPGTTLKI